MHPFKRGLFWILSVVGIVIAYIPANFVRSLYQLLDTQVYDTLWAAMGAIVLGLAVLAFPIIAQLLLDIPTYFFLRKKENRTDAQKFVFTLFGLIACMVLLLELLVFAYQIGADEYEAIFVQIELIASAIYTAVISLGFLIWRFVLKKMEKRG